MLEANEMRMLPVGRRVICFVVGAVFAMAGALVAKRTIDRAIRWETLLKEDSLAYDMAYTDDWRSDTSSYGSFVSNVWSDELDKFDV